MTFYTYMIKKHLDENSAEGDLAKDIKLDKTFPRNNSGKYDYWHDKIENYLSSHNACSQCIDVFDRCWVCYVEAEQKRLNKYK